MSYKTDHLNYCSVASGPGVRDVVGHDLIYPKLEDSLNKNREIPDPYCKHCFKTESVIREDYGNHLEEFRQAGLRTGYQSGLNH